ncbi:MAG: hypothetical protein ACNA7U_01260 [Candidatus Izemoplasmataceae bacterium]
MTKPLYTVVCRYYTIDGIFEVDLYEVFKKLDIQPFNHPRYGITWSHEKMIRHHVYTGQAVEYVIKRVIRNIELDEEKRYFYSHHEPYSILYECIYDLKDVENMNHTSIDIRMRMSEKDFNKIYGGK